MKNFVKKYLLIIVFFLAGVLSFTGIFAQTGQVHAEINKEFVNFVLTGGQNYYPYEYFDSLSQATYNDNITYLNKEGESSNLYRGIVDKVTAVFQKKHSTGQATFVLSNNMKKLAASGKYFVYASAGVLALKDDDNSKIVISVSHNGQTKSVTSEKVYEGGEYSPDWITTEKIYITDPNQTITFSFSNREKSSVINKADFIIFEPTLSFGVEIDEITTITTGGNVASGQLLELKAQTWISQVQGESPLLMYYKNYHKIEWEIVEGQNKASISGSYLNVTGSSGTIKIRAKCRGSSLNNEYKYSQEIILQIDNKLNSLNLLCNFSDGAILMGGGTFSVDYEDPYYSIFAKANSGYTFLKFVDEKGIEISSTRTATGYYKAVIDLSVSRKITAIMVKDVNISEIIIADKYYDKTKIAIIEKIVVEGLSKEHDVFIDTSQLISEYSTFLPGENIDISFTGKISLSGEDSYMYNFNETLPNYSFGNILKRDIIIIANNVEKTVGTEDPSLTYTFIGELASGDQLNGFLEREAGESLGEYIISQGSITDENNPNYNIRFDSEASGNFKITTRKIQITNVVISSKVYDATNTILLSNIELSITGQFINNNATLKYEAVYQTSEAVHDIAVNFNAWIEGEEEHYYELVVLVTDIRGDIIPRQIYITPSSYFKTYGEEDPDIFEFTYEGELLNNDGLSGKISRIEGEDAGTYKMVLGTLEVNANYELIINDVDFIINERQLEILAADQEKIYGDVSKEISFEIVDLTTGERIDALLPGNNILGSLSIGEKVESGVYDINLGNLSVGSNYKIVQTNLGQFKILKRDIVINISTASKDYDGTLDGTLIINIFNEVASDNLSIDILPKFDNKDASILKEDKAITYYFQGVVVSEFNPSLLSGNNISSYNIAFNVSYVSTINRKEINIVLNEDLLSAVYGDEIIVPYSAEGIVDGETLIGNLEVLENNVGTHTIMQGSLTEEENTNYIINFQTNKFFTINKREIKIIVDNKTIVYGEDEEEIVYYLADETPLQNNVYLTDILSGSPTREEGKSNGQYNYLIGSLRLKTADKNNYNLTFEGGVLTIEKRAIDITLYDSEKVYGEDDPIYSYIINLGDLVVEEDLLFIRDKGENVGEYTVNITLNENYEVTVNSATLTIVPTELKVKASNLLKTYGSEDPNLIFTITSGILMFNDTLENVFSGSLERTEGEGVGNYNVKQGSLQTNSNYSLVFEEGVLTIQKRDITVTAHEVSKFIDEEDFLELTYTVSGLINGDTLSGSLYVEMVNEFGEYDICIGTLHSDNYNIHFISAKLLVVKRVLYIEVDYVSREYDGTSSAELTYKLTGDMSSGDEENLGIILTKAEGSAVGKYLITANCSNTKYETIVIENYFEILPRKITITANNIEITYGEEIPDSKLWTYSVEGEIIGDELEISLYRTQNYCAGTFDILGIITNTSNYDITYIPGKLTINKREVYITVSDYEKIYGDSDPFFDYVLSEGYTLYNGDILRGGITRIEGERVGEYQLICSLSNDNYEIIMNEAKLTINKKQLILVTVALDKIYDGTNIAYLRVPKLSGILNEDDVWLDFSPDNIARFADAERGENKEVEIFGGELAGEEAENYYITRPSGLRASITISKIENGNVIISASKSNTKLKSGTTLISSEVESQQDFGKEKNIINSYEIGLLYNDEILNDYGLVTVSIDIDKGSYYNLQLFRINADGTKELIKSDYQNGTITFQTESLGTYVIIADNDTWLDIALIVLAVMTATFIIVLLGLKGFKKQRGKNKN